MSQAIADKVSAKCKVVAVSDAYKLVPDAKALVSTDAAWWEHHPDALSFKGRRFRSSPDFHDVLGVEKFSLQSGINSGLLACHVAVMLGATKLLLCGFDMGGSHYFGEHPAPLKNTTPSRFEVFKKQFAGFKPAGVEIINCTVGSQLICYPFGDLETHL